MDKPLSPQELAELKALEAESGEAPLTPEEQAELDSLEVNTPAPEEGMASKMWNQLTNVSNPAWYAVRNVVGPAIKGMIDDGAKEEGPFDPNVSEPGLTTPMVAPDELLTGVAVERAGAKVAGNLASKAAPYVEKGLAGAKKLSLQELLRGPLKSWSEKQIAKVEPQIALEQAMKTNLPGVQDLYHGKLQDAVTKASEKLDLEDLVLGPKYNRKFKYDASSLKDTDPELYADLMRKEAEKQQYAVKAADVSTPNQAKAMDIMGTQEQLGQQSLPFSQRIPERQMPLNVQNKGPSASPQGYAKKPSNPSEMFEVKQGRGTFDVLPDESPNAFSSVGNYRPEGTPQLSPQINLDLPPQVKASPRNITEFQGEDLNALRQQLGKEAYAAKSGQAGTRYSARRITDQDLNREYAKVRDALVSGDPSIGQNLANKEKLVSLKKMADDKSLSPFSNQNINFSDKAADLARLEEMSGLPLTKDADLFKRAQRKVLEDADPNLINRVKSSFKPENIAETFGGLAGKGVRKYNKMGDAFIDEAGDIVTDVSKLPLGLRASLFTEQKGKK
jgi:hypothetical protein